MVCKNCGQELAEGATFCAGCGTAVVAEKGNFLAENKKKLIIAAGAVVVAILAIILIVNLFGNGGGASKPEKLAEMYVEATLKQNYGKYAKCMNQADKNSAAQLKDASNSDIVNIFKYSEFVDENYYKINDGEKVDGEKVDYDKWKQEQKDDKVVKITDFEVIKVDIAEGEEAEDALEDYIANYERKVGKGKGKKISALGTVSFKYKYETAKGDIETVEEDSIEIVKIGSKWYLA